MEAKELRNLTVDELRSRVRGWREEYFRAQFKGQSQEMKDTSLFRKLRRDIARGMMVLGEKTRTPGAPAPEATAPVSDKPVKAKAEKKGAQK